MYILKGVSAIITVLMILTAPASLKAEDNNNDVDVLIGLIPERNLFEQYQRYGALTKYLSKKSGLRIEVKIFSQYADILEGFANNEVDAAFFGSLTGAVAHRRLGAEAMVRPVNIKGQSTYHGYVLTSRQSGIETVADMRGKVAVFVDKASSCGYLYPLAFLKEGGMDSIDGFFSEYFFAGSHDAAIKALLSGQADVGVAKNTVYDQMIEQNPEIKEKLVILDTSPIFPTHGFFVKKSLDDTIKEKLKTSMLDMHMNVEGQRILEKLGAAKYVETLTDNDYRSVFSLAEKAGIDLKTYEHINE